MENEKPSEKKHLRHKRVNFLSRMGQRISRLFRSHKTIEKDQSLSNDLRSPDDLPVTSKSHDNLSVPEKRKVKHRKKYGHSLNVPTATDRCVSEGDLTCGGGSGGLSPSGSGSLSRSHHGGESYVGSGAGAIGDNGSRTHFKNELANKLRANKSQPDSDSELCKTPDSPTAAAIMSGGADSGGGAVPRAESRTPRSLSSLSNSSNSLLSGQQHQNHQQQQSQNQAGGSHQHQQGSETESMMSHSVFEYSSEEPGIIVDLATPISQTTNAGMLDSSAARQKIAAARQRRVRPKAGVPHHAPTSPAQSSSPIPPCELSSSGGVTGNSPRQTAALVSGTDKEDKLEEIVEEDHNCTVSSAPIDIPVSSTSAFKRSLRQSDSSLDDFELLTPPKDDYNLLQELRQDDTSFASLPVVLPGKPIAKSATPEPKVQPKTLPKGTRPTTSKEEVKLTKEDPSNVQQSKVTHVRLSKKNESFTKTSDESKPTAKLIKEEPSKDETSNNQINKFVQLKSSAKEDSCAKLDETNVLVKSHKEEISKIQTIKFGQLKPSAKEEPSVKSDDTKPLHSVSSKEEPPKKFIQLKFSTKEDSSPKKEDPPTPEKPSVHLRKTHQSPAPIQTMPDSAEVNSAFAQVKLRPTNRHLTTQATADSSSVVTGSGDEVKGIPIFPPLRKTNQSDSDQSKPDNLTTSVVSMSEKRASRVLDMVKNMEHHSSVDPR